MLLDALDVLMQGITDPKHLRFEPFLAILTCFQPKSAQKSRPGIRGPAHRQGGALEVQAVEVVPEVSRGRRRHQIPENPIKILLNILFHLKII